MEEPGTYLYGGAQVHGGAGECGRGGAGAGWSGGGAAMGEEPALQSVRREGRWGSPREAFGEQWEAHIEAHLGAYMGGISQDVKRPFILWVFLTIYIFVALMKITMCFKKLGVSHIMSWDS